MNPYYMLDIPDVKTYLSYHELIIGVRPQFRCSINTKSARPAGADVLGMAMVPVQILSCITL